MPDPVLVHLTRNTSVSSFFRAYVAVLRADPVLQAQGVVIWAWEGDRLQTGTASTAMFRPSAEQVQNGLIRLTPGNTPTGRIDVVSQVGSFEIDIEIYSPGTHADDSLNLCEALMFASFGPAANEALDGIPGLFGRPKMANTGQGEVTIGEGRYCLLRKMRLSVQLRHTTG